MGSAAWNDADLLARRLGSWHHRFAGRDLFRVTAGPGWVRLQFAGDDRAGVLLTDLPGARLVTEVAGRLPESVVAALPLAPRHALVSLLGQARLTGCGLLPDDRVAAFRFARPGADDVVLLHRLFGSRGNTVLLDTGAHLLWSVHRPPHAALAAWPPAGTWDLPDAPAPTGAEIAAAVAAVATACADGLARRLAARLDRRHRAAERLVANLTRDLAHADRGDEHRRKAETLAAHLHTLAMGTAEVELPDLVTGTPLRIALDPAPAPAANLEAWFRRARKADKGLAVIRDRLAGAEADLATLAAATARLTRADADAPEPGARLAALQAWQADHPDLAPEPDERPRRRTPEEPARPFRRYLIDGRWEVWIGRSNTENDELTHRAAHNRDIWLHAQGVPGSHVILRTAGRPEQVPRTVLAKAAALAALHSKARHAGLVPVIHTEKRYVRKPRKAPAGTAVCLQDSSLFVAPGVMAGVEPA